VLIVGGGVGGMSAAISMRRAGMEVDLAEIDPNWKIYGAGITITGSTLRALKTLGVLDQVKAQGATWNWPISSPAAASGSRVSGWVTTLCRRLRISDDMSAELN
jgi:2-polyprenyl-6-methoxyphenol hydroxylase-like FAD-dependent oxidoreductase